MPIDEVLDDEVLDDEVLEELVAALVATELLVATEELVFTLELLNEDVLVLELVATDELVTTDELVFTLELATDELKDEMPLPDVGMEHSLALLLGIGSEPKVAILHVKVPFNTL